MEYVIRVIWDAEIQRDKKDLEILSDWANENISDVSEEATGDKDLFPANDRIVTVFDDDSGFRIDMSKIVDTNAEEFVLDMMKIARLILENSGANMDHVVMSYEPI